MRKSKTSVLALCAILSALAAAVLYLSCLVPAGRWALVAVAGLLPVAAVISLGAAGGGAVWVVAGFLGLLLLPDKLNALLFALFFGPYGVVKSLLERKLPFWAALLGKLVFFNAVLAVFFLAFSKLLFPVLPEWLVARSWLVFLLGSGVFLVYDFGLSKLIAFYVQRMGKELHKHGI